MPKQRHPSKSGKSHRRQWKNRKNQRQHRGKPGKTTENWGNGEAIETIGKMRQSLPPRGAFNPITCPPRRALLEREGCDRGKFQSGCRAVTGDVKRLGGRLLAVGAGVGGWECLWGRVRAGVLGGRGVPPPPFKQFPAPTECSQMAPNTNALHWENMRNNAHYDSVTSGAQVLDTHVWSGLQYTANQL